MSLLVVFLPWLTGMYTYQYEFDDCKIMLKRVLSYYNVNFSRGVVKKKSNFVALVSVHSGLKHFDIDKNNYIVL